MRNIFRSEDGGRRSLWINRHLLDLAVLPFLINGCEHGGRTSVHKFVSSNSKYWFSSAIFMPRLTDKLKAGSDIFSLCESSDIRYHTSYSHSNL